MNRNCVLSQADMQVCLPKFPYKPFGAVPRSLFRPKASAKHPESLSGLLPYIGRHSSVTPTFSAPFPAPPKTSQASNSPKMNKPKMVWPQTAEKWFERAARQPKATLKWFVRAKTVPTKLPKWYPTAPQTEPQKWSGSLEPAQDRSGEPRH